MANRRKSASLVEWLMLIVVIAIPVALAVVYALNQRGFFQAPSAATAPVGSQISAPQPSQQQPIQDAPSQASITLDDPGALPQTVTTGEIVPFSFTIENSGAGDATYQYKVSVKWNSGEVDVIDVNSVSLKSGASTDIPESLKFETAPATADITIEIEQPEQNIHFTLPRS
jgi:hypothetical protein